MAPNELTASEDRDSLAGTPWHKHVPARLEAIALSGVGEQRTSDVDPAALEWLERFAAALGVPAPSLEEVTALLDLAGTAAHASHRQAAPVACWLAAAGRVHPGRGPRAGDVPGRLTPVGARRGSQAGRRDHGIRDRRRPAPTLSWEIAPG